jgi:hypothetical protein
MMETKDKFEVALLDLIMPNGKPMRYCTGAEMIAFGEGFIRIGKSLGAETPVERAAPKPAELDVSEEFLQAAKEGW